MVLEQLFGGPRRRALGGRGTHDFNLVGRHGTGTAREGFADIREGGGDLLVAEHGTLRGHDDIVGLTGDFDRTFHATKHDLDRARSGALGPVAADQGRQAIESFAVGAVAGDAEGVIDLGAVFGRRHEDKRSQKGEERRGAHKGYPTIKPPISDGASRIGSGRKRPEPELTR